MIFTTSGKSNKSRFRIFELQKLFPFHTWMNVYVDLPSNKISTLLRNYGVSPVSVYYCHSILKQITWFAVQAKWIVSIWNATEYWAERVHIRRYSGPYFPALGSNTRETTENTDQNNSEYGHLVNTELEWANFSSLS